MHATQDSPRRPHGVTGIMTAESREIDCEAALAELWDYLDGELTPERKRRIELHLTKCVRCLPHVKFAERFLEALHCCQGDCHMPDALRNKVLEKLKREGLMS